MSVLALRGKSGFSLLKNLDFLLNANTLIHARASADCLIFYISHFGKSDEILKIEKKQFKSRNIR